MDIGLDSSRTGGDEVLTVAGEIDVHTSDQLRDNLLALLDGDADRVVVDLSAVSFMDSTGLGAVAAGLDKAESTGTALVVVCPPGLRRLFAITGLDGAVHLAGSLRDVIGDARDLRDGPSEPDGSGARPADGS